MLKWWIGRLVSALSTYEDRSDRQPLNQTMLNFPDTIFLEQETLSDNNFKYSPAFNAADQSKGENIKFFFHQFHLKNDFWNSSDMHKISIYYISY